jgi:hypothetical protein
MGVGRKIAAQIDKRCLRQGIRSAQGCVRGSLGMKLEKQRGPHP